MDQNEAVVLTSQGHARRVLILLVKIQMASEKRVLTLNCGS